MKEKKQFQYFNILAISISHFIHDVYPAFVAPIVDELKQKLSINNAQIGFLSVMMRIPFLLNPIIGVMAERFKMRFFIIFAPALTAICMSLIGVAPSYTILIILFFVAGISSSLFHVPTPVMIKKVSGSKVGKGMSFYMVGGELARTIGPLIIVAAVTQWGLEGTYKVMPLGLIASAILFFRLKKIDIRKDIEVRKDFSHYMSSFKQFLPVFMVLAGITLTRGFMKSALTLYLPTFLREQGNDIWTAGVALSTLQLSGVAGTFFSGTLSDKIGRKKMLMIIAIASPILMWLFVSYHEILAFPILIIIGFFLVAPQSVMLAVIHDLDTDNLPFVNGVYMTINFLISSLCLLAVGWVSDHIGLLQTFKITAVLALGAIFFVLRLKK